VLNSRAFSQDVFIVSSSDIIPFKTCVEGIKESMSDFSLKISNIEEDLKKGDEVLAEIREKNPKITIAVGPKAAFVLSQDHDLLPKIFCMVLNPDKLLAQNGMYPGVSLNIPPEFQLETIMKAFPERKRIGVFFNKKSNQSTIDKFYEEAKNLNVVLVRFPILSANDIPAIINSKEFSIDVLLVIPDSKIESTKIAEYIIEESLRRKIPVVGYNSWFVKNGALLSFIIDYREVGIQTGQAAKRMISEGSSIYNGIIPLEKITISLDLKTAKKLGVRISPEIIQKATEVIE
jgi:putative ABC transport system substrate-binding protein